jgi:hypothetical protein
LTVKWKTTMLEESEWGHMIGWVMLYKVLLLCLVI